MRIPTKPVMIGRRTYDPAVEEDMQAFAALWSPAMERHLARIGALPSADASAPVSESAEEPELLSPRRKRAKQKRGGA